MPVTVFEGIWEKFKATFTNQRDHPGKHDTITEIFVVIATALPITDYGAGKHVDQ